MYWLSLAALALVAPTDALIRFSCSQLVRQRLDPLVNPGMVPSTHAHQIVGGNTFNASMDPKMDIAGKATCTTCTFSEDFSNYWTAILYFKARNGTYKRVSQIPNSGFDGANQGGMTIYYMQNQLADYEQKSKVTAFKPGFRMLIGNPTFETKAQAQKFRQLTYTCLKNIDTRFPETMDFPKQPCAHGIMANLRFPTCWDGKNLDSPDHQSHMAYPVNGTFENQGPCPESHPVRMPQLMYETIWDTRPFNNKEDWPEDGSQPFVWSFGDQTGFGTHGDYVFGWQGDALQRVMDSPCYVNCPTLKTQTIEEANKCSMEPVVKEDIDGWLTELPGINMGPMDK
ncbi:hypothetical protein GQ43DRAFT_450228 [Delitschia confertaspora ATCC 74209]|uniref:DUF1996 domain-containing protein n=1 Tax=Delitschia confertaspora ATCC 74209 TaxID=1513339 RepID=A0A9P4JHX0_9PLEO|nr:hypothetical protein GQ43DRAFT_450228 [Delitschia confertaspora ATCC 74209]